MTGHCCDQARRRNPGPGNGRREGARVGGVGRKSGLRLEHQADCPDRRQATVGAGGGELRVIVHAGNDLGEDVGLEAGAVEEVVLEELAGRVRLGVDLQGQDAVWTIGQPHQHVLEGLWQ